MCERREKRTKNERCGPVKCELADVVKYIISTAHQYLAPSGWLALEMGWDQGKAVVALAEETGKYKPARILKDYSGHDRVAILEKKEYHACF
ncbi:hypothetical protein LJC47_00010 [Desulfosarcina sp. OttesenSCG-928-B08]|nr:hypothetical protein [Desulfosarcina sp. OttesenSCG-928-B08]